MTLIADYQEAAPNIVPPHILAPLGSWATDAIITSIPRRAGVTEDDAVLASRIAVHRGHQAYQIAYRSALIVKNARLHAGELLKALQALRDAEMIMDHFRRWRPQLLADLRIAEGDLESLSDLVARLSGQTDRVAEAARGKPGRASTREQRAFVLELAEGWVSITGRVPRAAMPTNGTTPPFHLFVERAAKEVHWRNTSGLASIIKHAVGSNRAALDSKAAAIQKSRAFCG